MPFIVHQGCHIVQIDIPKLVGLLEAEISQIWPTFFDMRYVPTTRLVRSELSLRRTARLPCAISKLMSSVSPTEWKIRRYALGHIVGDPVKGWEDFVIHDGPLVKDGRILIPDKPGLGVEPKPGHVRGTLLPRDLVELNWPLRSAACDCVGFLRGS